MADIRVELKWVVINFCLLVVKTLFGLWIKLWKLKANKNIAKKICPNLENVLLERSWITLLKSQKDRLMNCDKHNKTYSAFSMCSLWISDCIFFSWGVEWSSCYWNGYTFQVASIWHLSKHTWGSQLLFHMLYSCITNPSLVLMNWQKYLSLTFSLVLLVVMLFLDKIFENLIEG